MFCLIRIIEFVPDVSSCSSMDIYLLFGQDLSLLIPPTNLNNQIKNSDNIKKRAVTIYGQNKTINDFRR